MVGQITSNYCCNGMKRLSKNEENPDLFVGKRERDRGNYPEESVRETY